MEQTLLLSGVFKTNRTETAVANPYVTVAAYEDVNVMANPFVFEPV